MIDLRGGHPAVASLGRTLKSPIVLLPTQLGQPLHLWLSAAHLCLECGVVLQQLLYDWHLIWH